MTSLHFHDAGKPLIELYATTGTGLIFPCESGVLYTNQTGGYACLHPVEEGVYAPLYGKLIDQEKKLFNYFTESKYGGWCSNGIDLEDADIIDEILDEGGIPNV